jgi:hypothetical protein
MTFGVGLLLLGISSFWFFGMLLVFLAASFSSHRRWTGPRYHVALIFVAGAAVRELILHWRDGDVFAREPSPFWFWIVLIAIWLWSIVAEFHKWRKNRILA